MAHIEYIDIFKLAQKRTEREELIRKERNNPAFLAGLIIGLSSTKNPRDAGMDLLGYAEEALAKAQARRAGGKGDVIVKKARGSHSG